MLKKGLCFFFPLSLLCCAVFMNCDNGNGPNPVTKPLEIVSPKGGESYTVGQSVEIKWKINDASKIGSVGITLSLDNGKTFSAYDLELTSIYPPTTTFSWTIASDQVSDQCVIEVREYNDHSINDKSGAFTVSN